MTFEEKLEKQFQNLSLTPIKRTINQYYLYADYVELLALVSNETYITQTDLANRFHREGLNPAEQLQSRSSIKDATLNAENNDAEENWARSIFDILSNRQAIFSTQYPYKITKSGIILEEKLSPEQKLYLILLIASNLNYFRPFEPELTSEFEKISFQALKAMLPSHGIYKQFGKNSDYCGSAQEKIRTLAEDLNVEIVENEVKKILGSQEKGLDLIAWIPFQDQISNMLTIVGQCACGKEWPKKQRETKKFEETYYRFFRLKPIHALFIPYSLIIFSEIYDSGEIDTGTFLFERKRIMELIYETSFLDSMTSKKLVEKCIEFEEDLV